MRSASASFLSLSRKLRTVETLVSASARRRPTSWNRRRSSALKVRACAQWWIPKT
jgi:hypothetical protein